MKQGIEQVALADRIGIKTSLWEIEHHFLEEYSHSSAGESFLVAASQNTKRIRLGSGICLMPPGLQSSGASSGTGRGAGSAKRRARRVGTGE